MNHFPQAWGRVSQHTSLFTRMASLTTTKPAKRRHLRPLRPFPPSNDDSKPTHPITHRDRDVGDRREIQGRRSHRRRQPRIVRVPGTLHRRETAAALRGDLHRGSRGRRLRHAIPLAPADITGHSRIVQQARPEVRSTSQRGQSAHLSEQGVLQAPLRIQPLVESDLGRWVGRRR